MKKSVILLAAILLTANISYGQNDPVGAAFPVPRTLNDKTPSGIYWAQARCDIATPLKGVPTNGIIEVDFLEVIQENLSTGQRKIIAREDYNNSGQPITTHQGGLYERNPWYVTNDSPRILSNSTQQNGILIIRAGEQPNFISHIWTPCNKIDPNTRAYVRARFRISGEIGFQIGLDYSPTADCSMHNHIEAFVSKWYGDTNGEFVDVTVPDYSMKKSYDRSHYGVYSNGKYFLSAEMVNDYGASSVYLKSNVTKWQPERMILEGDYYVFYSNHAHNQKALYCFMLDRNDNAHIPALLINDGESQLIDTGDAVPNSSDGYNFYTFPLQIVNSSHD
jgi:hypothetical protein